MRPWDRVYVDVLVVEVLAVVFDLSALLPGLFCLGPHKREFLLVLPGVHLKVLGALRVQNV